VTVAPVVCAKLRASVTVTTLVVVLMAEMMRLLSLLFVPLSM
jgi:hypothetical protein